MRLWIEECRSFGVVVTIASVPGCSALGGGVDAGEAERLAAPQADVVRRLPLLPRHDRTEGVRQRMEGIVNERQLADLLQPGR